MRRAPLANGRTGSPTSTATAAWPRATTVALVTVGGLLAAFLFTVVTLMPDLPWHSARDAELRATVQTYRETGVLLIKPTGSGSTYTMIEAPGPLSPAAWDDDPASYVVASLMTHLTGTDDPYPGLKLFQASMVALPMLWLPLAVARVFRRARAGYALLALPLVLWLVNGGTLLPGTEYGLSDAASSLRVYALYGLSASVAFGSLTLLLLLSTTRLRWPLLLGATALMGLLAGTGNLFRAHSGLGIAVATGVLWWLATSGLWRRVGLAIVGALVATTIAYGLQSASMTQLNVHRSEATGMRVADLPIAHGTWHPLYLGLAFPQPLTGEPSPFGIEWSDKFGWDKVHEVDPTVAIATDEYDIILKDIYLDTVLAAPGTALRLYLAKALFVVKHFGAMFITIILGFVLALSRRGLQRRALWAGLAVCLPLLVWGFVPPVMVMPLLYYFSEIAAALGLLLALAVGALAWSLTSMPAHVRASERRRIAGRVVPPDPTSDSISVVVPCRNGEATIASTLTTLAERLRPSDEVIVVENGSTDNTRALLHDLQAGWTAPCQLVVTHSRPGLGNAYREGVLRSTGGRVLLTADDLPFGMSDFDQFLRVPDDVPVAIGSKAHPESRAERGGFRALQSTAFRLLRAALLQSRVADSQGTFWLDGRWARSYAVLSHEEGLMWTTELVLAAEQQGLPVHEVPVVLQDSHAAVSTRFKLADAWRSFVGFTRLAVYKDDYKDEEWPTARV